MIYKFNFRDDISVTNYSVDPSTNPEIPERVQKLLGYTTLQDGIRFDASNPAHLSQLPTIYKIGASRIWVTTAEPTFKAKARFKGGLGSGFEGHAGRPGQVGGSQPSYTRPREFAKVVRKKFKDAIITSRGYEGLALGGNIVVHFYENKYHEIKDELKTLAEDYGYVVGYTNLQDVSPTGVNSVGVTLELKGLRDTKEMRKIIAKRGDSDYLVDIGNEQGVVVSLLAQKSFKSFNIQSIIARGYWMNYEDNPEIEKQVFALL